MSNEENNKRIAKNTLILYVRMLFTMIVSLYTSRVILSALGVVDYGINDSVGGLVGMFSIISGSLSAAVSRFLTFELGKGDKDNLRRIFSTSVIIHICLAFVVFALMETIGTWFLNNKMTIPYERIMAAQFVFQASIISFMINLFSVPYNASIIAHEKMGAFAFIGTFQVIMNLINISFVAYAPFRFDNLIVFSCLSVLLNLAIQIIYIIYCRARFEECKVSLVIDKYTLKSIGTFSGWNFIGASSAVLRDQGGTILLNLFYGPSANAARAVAGSVNRAVSAFASNFMTAINPQITKSYATGDNEYMMSLISRSARFAFYLLLILSLPILFNTYDILDIWLKDVPDHSVLFVQLILVFTLCESLSTPLITAMLATGNIRNYQLIVGGLQLMNLPISYLFLKMGAFQEVVLVVAIIISTLCLMARVIMLQSMIGLNARAFASNVVLNVSYVCIVALSVPLFMHIMLPHCWWAILVSCVTCIISSSISVLYLGCTKDERVFLLNKLILIISKFHR